MSTTLLQARTDLRAHLDETTARFWTDAQLNTWINEACRDVARRTETIQDFRTSVNVLPGTSVVTMPADVLRVHRLEYVPESDNTLVYPITLTTYDELDQVWGIMQDSPMNYPYFAAMWGFPPSLKMRLYPVPSQAGFLNIFYYRTPKTTSTDADTLDILEGWEDLIVLYAEYVARRKDRDPTWQDAKAVYEERLGNMVDTTRHWHDQAGTITVGQRAVPRWLYDFNYGGY